MYMRTASQCSTLCCAAMRCDALQHAATPWIALQHTVNELCRNCVASDDTKKTTHWFACVLLCVYVHMHWLLFSLLPSLSLLLSVSVVRQRTATHCDWVMSQWCGMWRKGTIRWFICVFLFVYVYTHFFSFVPFLALSLALSLFLCRNATHCNTLWLSQVAIVWQVTTKGRHVDSSACFYLCMYTHTFPLSFILWLSLSLSLSLSFSLSLDASRCLSLSLSHCNALQQLWLRHVTIMWQVTRWSDTLIHLCDSICVCVHALFLTRSSSYPDSLFLSFSLSLSLSLPISVAWQVTKRDDELIRTIYSPLEE